MGSDQYSSLNTPTRQKWGHRQKWGQTPIFPYIDAREKNWGIFKEKLGGYSHILMQKKLGSRKNWGQTPIFLYWGLTPRNYLCLVLLGKSGSDP